MSRDKNKTILTLGGIFALIVLLWSTPLLLPLKILVVFFHEMSHGLAAVLTGGEIDRITVEMNQGGKAWTHGGSRFITVSAGYLGSFLWGSGLILGSAWMKRDKMLTGSLGFVLAYVTIFYVRNLSGILFGLAVSATLLAAARKLDHESNDFILKVIGVTSCGYAILDIYSDVIARSCWSDARILASMTSIPATAWGCLWIGLSLFGLYHTLRFASAADSH